MLVVEGQQAETDRLTAIECHPSQPVGGGVCHEVEVRGSAANDYAERDHTRFWLKALLYCATVFIVLLGTLVIFTFDPNLG